MNSEIVFDIWNSILRLESIATVCMKWKHVHISYIDISYFHMTGSICLHELNAPAESYSYDITT